MNRLLPVLIVGLLVTRTETLRADGGAIRAREQAGAFQVSVFTSPNPLVSGPVDLSVLVQDAATLAPVADAQVEVTFTPRGRAYAAWRAAATGELATNKLFRDCHVELERGWYDVEIAVTGAQSAAAIEVALEVGPPPTRAAAFWPWYTWPCVPIVLFGLHEWLASRRRL